MPRTPRNASGGIVYHVLNRANGRLRLFKRDADFLAFERVLVAAQQRTPIPILDWCIMSNHWHLMLFPEHDGQLTQFMRWLTLTHAQRWKQAHGAVGHGHLYQGRFKSFPVEQDEQLLAVLRYVERNPLRAGPIKRAQNRRWGSCHVRQDRTHELYHLLSPWPLPQPRRWLETINEPQSEIEEMRVAQSIQHSRPLGSDGWTNQMAQRLDLLHTLRPRGRPPGWRKESEKRRKSK